LELRVLNESKVDESEVLTQTGSATVRRLHLPTLEVGTVQISNHSVTPRKVHSHPEAQVFYVLNGSGFVTNGKSKSRIARGDFVITEPNEEHYFITERRKLSVLEVKFRY